MHLTSIVFNARVRGNPNHNHIRVYKYFWQMFSKRRLIVTGEKKALEARGFSVHKASSLLTPAYDVPKAEDYYPPLAAPAQPQELLHTISHKFSPVLGKSLALMQHLSWSVLSHSLPDAVLDRRRDVMKDEQQLFEQDIMAAHLLDGHVGFVSGRALLNLELPNKLHFEEDYMGLTVPRKNGNLTQLLVDTLDQIGLDPLQLLTRTQVQDTQVSLAGRYNGDLVLVRLPCALSVCAGCPLPAVVPPSSAELFVAPEVDEKTRRMIIRKQMKAQTGGPLQQPLPDIRPLSAYIGAALSDRYGSINTRYVSGTSSSLCPHTVHLHRNEPLLQLDSDQLSSLTLLQLFAHAVSYAITSGAKVNASGHLCTPIVVQGVHSHLNLVQPAVFQLNTLGPHWQFAGGPDLDPEAVASGSNVRNIFFYQDLTKLYEQCDVNDVGLPVITGLNTELLATLRALHETGLDD